MAFSKWLWLHGGIFLLNVFSIFIMKGCWNFIQWLFQKSIEMTVRFLPFIMFVHHYFYLSVLKLACIPKIFKNRLIFYVYVFFLHVYMWITCVPCAHGGQKAALNPLELEIQMIESHHVGAGYQMSVSFKGNKCS